MSKLNELALGYSGAIVSAASMLLLGIFGKIGVYNGMNNMMMQWHMFYSISFIGVITGMIEAAVISFVFMYSLGWAYNKFV